jgi:acetyl-CoA/propionyl-CoA carboxylase carboxyl transferase subunit
MSTPPRLHTIPGNSRGNRGPGPAHVVEQLDPRSPQARLTALLHEPTITATVDGASIATGEIDGSPVVAFATDVARQGGALGYESSTAIARSIDDAVRRGVPSVGIWHSGGARLNEGVASLEGVAKIFQAMTSASGRIPQLSLVLGAAAGGAAYGPALTDIVVMGPDARIFVTGPDVVRSVTGEDVTGEALGGPATHGRSGVAHVTEPTDELALQRIRDLTGLLAKPRKALAAFPEDDPFFNDFLPENRRRAYDVRPLVGRLLDQHSPQVELQPTWAPNIVTKLGRLGGRSVGVIANNPLRMGGCLNALSAEKASRFVRMCDAFGVPLVVIVDVPGYLPGVRQEHEAVVRRGAKLLHAFAAARVPRVTLVTRKAYGGAYIAMNSRGLGATAVMAWPTAEMGVMGAPAAIKILKRREIAAAAEGPERDALEVRLAEEYERETAGLQSALNSGAVDQIIEPATSRRMLARALAIAPDRRGAHGNIPL